MIDLPFTARQFLDLFQNYNQAIWPAQIVAYLFGVGIIFILLKSFPKTNRLISGFLSLFWIWTGLMYHILFFSRINTAAYIFGSLFIIQGLLFIYAGIVQRNLQFEFNMDLMGITGLLFVTYALLIYPFLGYLMGHGYPQSPVFGVTPCPVTIFTFGMLLWTKHRIPGWLLAIPFAWSMVGFTAALKLGILEDTGLIIAGITGTALLVYRNRSKRQSKPASAF